MTSLVKLNVMLFELKTIRMFNYSLNDANSFVRSHENEEKDFFMGLGIKLELKRFSIRH